MKIFCPHCFVPVQFSWEAFGQKKSQLQPEPGDAAVCAKCAGVSVIEPDFSRRKVTEEEMASLDDDHRAALDGAVALIRAQINKAN